MYMIERDQPLKVFSVEHIYSITIVIGIPNTVHDLPTLPNPLPLDISAPPPSLGLLIFRHVLCRTAQMTDYSSF